MQMTMMPATVMHQMMNLTMGDSSWLTVVWLPHLKMMEMRRTVLFCVKVPQAERRLLRACSSMAIMTTYMACQ